MIYNVFSPRMKRSWMFLSWKILTHSYPMITVLRIFILTLAHVLHILRCVVAASFTASAQLCRVVHHRSVALLTVQSLWEYNLWTNATVRNGDIAGSYCKLFFSRQCLQNNNNCAVQPNGEMQGKQWDWLIKEELLNYTGMILDVDAKYLKKKSFWPPQV